MTDKQSRLGTDWEALLAPDEKGTRKDEGRELAVVLLKGLQRLAQLAGLQRSRVELLHVPSASNGKQGLVQAIYYGEFEDGTQWVGTADCNTQNTSPKFMKFPTAVAESRAESRMLRKALGISTLSSEEVGFQDDATASMNVTPGQAVASSVVKAMTKLAETKGVDLAQVIEAAVEDGERARTIFELTSLTAAEGQRAMAWLNGKKQTAAKSATRSDRKAELLAKKGK